MNKIKDCYEIGSEIIDEYDKLKRMIFSNDFDGEEFKKCIDTIKGLVKHEYVLYGLLDSENMVFDEIAKLISVEPTDLKPFQNRFSQKIFNSSVITKLLTEKHSISLDGLFPPTEIPPYMVFNLDDILCYMFEVDTFLKVERGLEVLNSSDTIDDGFLKQMWDIHNRNKFDYFIVRSSSEIISIYHGFDIDKYPKIDFKRLISKLSEKYGYSTRYTKKYLQNKIMTMIKACLNDLSRFDDVYKNSETYYQYMLRLNLLDCYISYLDCKYLTDLLDYLEKLDVKSIDVKYVLKKRLTKEK